ncbi:MAG: glycyl-radical enzyme activating protein [Kiritimatiellae bacterium]|jgi:pyruvate formate lyase activating enzyme|nr:glycyl-radical enzyme activating protein [Kiritimatiellia bacterium]
MSLDGIIFEVREFCLHDGPGIRTLVFFKGCPLRCVWCHNPEGFSDKPQLLVNTATCIHCDACRNVCQHPDECILCGECVTVCPQGCRHICGRRVSAETLASELNTKRDFFQKYGGGITFSGGEPLAQADFLVDLAERLRPIHLAIETSGFAPLATYQRAVQSVDLVFQDLKHPDAVQHKKYTGVDPQPIFDNLAWLKTSGKPFIARIPLIPGVNDAPETLERFADMLTGTSGLKEIELLPYHKMAGAKYSSVGLTYAPPFDTDRPCAPDLTAFTARGLPCRVM